MLKCTLRWLFFAAILLVPSVVIAQEPKGHAFLATGGQTYIMKADGKTAWSYPQSSRDGWVLENGNILLALSKNKEHPGGAIIEVTRDGKSVFTVEGTQSEVNTVQEVGKDRYMLTEAGNKPRVLEVDRTGNVLLEFPIQAQTKDHHLQTRMTRKLKNGNYLVPQLLDKVVREYDPTGKIVWEAKTPDMAFTAIRLENGNTLVGCTHGDTIVEFDKAGRIVWQVTNADLPGKPIHDACGVQRLANGNTVFTSYGAKKEEDKLFEITPEKKIVWVYKDPTRPSIHHFQILDADLKPVGSMR
jgi:hypothetical protein